VSDKRRRGSQMNIGLHLVGLVLVAFGPAALVAPETAAYMFGIPADTSESRAYLLAAATRDVALGTWLLALLRLRVGQRVLAASVLAIAIVAAGDATNVLLHSGSRSGFALVGHVGGLGALLALAWWLWRADQA
jgi:hypothetical protein